MHVDGGSGLNDDVVRQEAPPSLGYRYLRWWYRHVPLPQPVQLPPRAVHPRRLLPDPWRMHAAWRHHGLTPPSGTQSSAHHCRSTVLVPSSFDLSIFRLWHYDLFLLSNFLFALGYFPLLMYVSSRAEKELAISADEANFLPMIIAIANIVGRITVTLVLASERTNKTGVLALAETVGGIVIIVSVFAQSYVTTVVFCVVYGVVGGIIMVAFPVVLADLVPSG